MKRQRIEEILAAYRPGEDLETDPGVRYALEQAEADPALAAILEQNRAFDTAFAEALDRAEVPADLRNRILESAVPVETAKVLRWFYPASFGIAAAIIIMLALSFTYWNRPVPEAPPMMLAQDPIASTAQALYASLNPSFKSRNGDEVREYLLSHSASVPSTLPGNVVWDKAFACDVIDFSGYEVSIVCFRAPDNSRTMHLFTFHRKEFPNVEVPSRPVIRKVGSSCCATWESEDRVHVLYSDKGEENLRQILDI